MLRLHNILNMNFLAIELIINIALIDNTKSILKHTICFITLR